jgi:hypothetical protein
MDGKGCHEEEEAVGPPLGAHPCPGSSGELESPWLGSLHRLLSWPSS